MQRRAPLGVHSGGLVIAIVSFVITRMLLSEAVAPDSPGVSVLIPLIPMVIGLFVTIYGVSIAIGTVSRAYVQTVTRWFLLSTGVLTVVLLATTMSPFGAMTTRTILLDEPIVSGNILLSGMVGGILIGHRSARLSRQRLELRQQRNRALLLDRLLRHEVLNAVTIIRGYAGLADGASGEGTSDVIQRSTDTITRAIDDVSDIIEAPNTSSTIDGGPHIRNAIDSAKDRFSEIDIRADVPASVEVAATETIQLVLRELIENAAEDPETETVVVSVASDAHAVTISVADDGSGLPAVFQELLESGQFPQYDDPGAGFGLQLVRVVISQVNGVIDVDPGLDGVGTTITIRLPRNQNDALSRSIDPSQLPIAVVGGILAGTVMGLFLLLQGNDLTIIGALYGVEAPIVGWITHLFHSIVFALIFLGIITHPSLQWSQSRPQAVVGLGLAWGVTLWLFAAGIIMPVWLRLLGQSAAIPQLPTAGLISHVVWGTVLGMSILGLCRVGWQEIIALSDRHTLT